MNVANDATRLANLLTEQRHLRRMLETNSGDSSSISDQLKENRDACLELVERYFRQTLRPVLAARFPGKGIHSPPLDQSIHSNDALFRYTELVSDFFIQVLSKHDDPFWKKDSAIELRNYASTVISNDIRDALRRRTKVTALGDDEVRESFDDQLASEVERKFLTDGVELPIDEVFDVLNGWDEESELRGKMATVIRHKYIADMEIRDIANDLKVPYSTVCRYHAEAIGLLQELLCPTNG